jgi:hypothetical protein
VAWTKPTEDGDRSDLEFILELLPPLQESTQTPLCNMSKIVVGLIPYTNYSIRVGSQNGVNKMLQQPAYSAYVNFRTKEDGKYIFLCQEYVPIVEQKSNEFWVTSLSTSTYTDLESYFCFLSN